MRKNLILCLLLTSLALAQEPPKEGETGAVQTPSGLSYTIVKKGEGEPVKPKESVRVNFTGWLKDGTKFDSSQDRGGPIRIQIVKGQVITGWEEGLIGMQNGEIRRLYIPPSLGYGDKPYKKIPANSELVFEVELLSHDTRNQPPAAGESGQIPTTTGLSYTILQPGQGEAVKSGEKISAHYTGWLRDGTKFDSSLDRGRPIDITIGVGQVIPGWDQGIVGMKTGEVRRLYIPANLGYGARGTPGGPIPPNAELVFEVELVNHQP